MKAKKDEVKKNIMDINVYKSLIFNKKKLIAEKQIKVEKLISFLPNTQLSYNLFQQIKGNPQESLSHFKKKLDYLNYFKNN